MHQMADIAQALQQLNLGWSLSNLHNATIDHMDGGYSHQNYRFTYLDNAYVLRLGVPHAEPNTQLLAQRRLEVAVQTMLPQLTGFLTAPLIATNAEQGLLLTRYVEQPVLAHLALAQREESPVLESNLLHYLRKLFSALQAVESELLETISLETMSKGQPPPAPLLPSYDPIKLAKAWLQHSQWPSWLQPWLTQAQWPLGRTTAASSAAQTTTQWQLCHNDLNPWNLLVHEDNVARWVTLDWETLGFNDPLFDVVSLHQGLGFDAGPLPQFAASALGVAIDPNRLLLVQRSYWLREYAWAVNQQQRGNQRAEIAEQVQTAGQTLRLLLT